MNRKLRRAQGKHQNGNSAVIPAGQIGPMIQTALHHHQSGRLVEADSLYRQILAQDPRHTDALHLLGMIAHQVGRNEVAIELIGQAIALNGTVPLYYSNQGAALQALGRWEEALLAYDAVLRLQPESIEAHFNRASLLQTLGRFEAALTAYDTVLRLRPDLAEAHLNRGNVLQSLDRSEAALAAYDAALRLRPDFVEAHFNRGNALQKSDRREEAVTAYEMALRLQPAFAEAALNQAKALQGLGRLEAALAACDVALRGLPEVAEAHFCRGTLLQALGHQEAALEAYDRALHLRPDLAEAHFSRGTLLQRLARPEAALAAYDAALRLRPDYAEASANRGNALQKLGQLEAALLAYDTALRFKPDLAEAHSNRGNLLQSLGRFDGAQQAYATALRLKPDYPEAHYNRGLGLLLEGAFEAGWDEYEWRWRLPGAISPRHQTLPAWRGEPANGRTLLVWWEQGFGDTIQFVRYLPRLVRQGWRVVFEVHPAQFRLFSPQEGVVIVAQGDPLPECDVQCALLSLPFLFGTMPETIPWESPYLQADPAPWRARLPDGGVKVGLVWQGSPDHKDDRNRSIPLTCFAPLAAVPGVRLLSLQKNYGLDQLAALPEGMSVQTLGPDYDRGQFCETAGVIMALDLVIAVDTSVAHLAGALGRPVWVALPVVPDWRWGLGREDSPWYPTMRLFRQTERGRWDDVFARMADALGGLIGQPVVGSSFSPRMRGEKLG